MYNTLKYSDSNLMYQFFLLILGIIALFLVIVVKSKTAIAFWNSPIIFFYTIFVTTFQLSRVAGAMAYRFSHKKVLPIAPAVGYEPYVTFVIPCKNEKETIYKTIEKCFEANYPVEKIEVIIINDGSTDGTGKILKRAKEEFSNLVVVNWRKNRGKRHGMAEGIKRAKGEIIIEVDGDSYVAPESLRGFIQPFQNPEIGAVCARTDPENSDQNLLTKMQAAYYFVSFRILKAAESTFFSVFCCSGCASAYRKSVILPILNKWLREKFLGLLITWGDDRALTNWVLRKDYKTIYCDDVQAYTICPTKLTTFLKQQVRWKKGWFVNSIFASRFVMKKNPFVAITYFFPLILVTLLTPFMALKALVYNPLVGGISPMFYITGVLLVTSVMTIYYRSISRSNKYWPYIFVWSAINMALLSFILFYALATIQNRKWGTR